jgi:hypothetical protein
VTPCTSMKRDVLSVVRCMRKHRHMECDSGAFYWASKIAERRVVDPVRLYEAVEDWLRPIAERLYDPWELRGDKELDPFLCLSIVSDRVYADLMDDAYRELVWQIEDEVRVNAKS